MRRIVLYLLLLAAIACQDVQYPPVHRLSGDWLRTNNKAAQTTIEHWEKTKDKFVGYGKTYSLDSLVFSEEMEIIMQEGEYFMLINGVNQAQTSFKITAWDEEYFIAENSNNEFPKWINYRFTEDSMIAIIGDQQDQERFDFIRIEKEDLE